MRYSAFCQITLLGGILAVSTLSLQAEELTLLFAGDAMQHQAQIEAADNEGEYRYPHLLTAIEQEIQAADLAVVNLEAPLGGYPYRGYPLFSAPDAYASALRDAGFDLFLLANNHILDVRTAGMQRTCRVLDSIGVKHIGVYANADEQARYHPLLLRCKGVRIAFLNYTYGTNGHTPAFPCVVNYIEPNFVFEEIKRARQLGAELIVVTLHWGEEYRLSPSQAQRAFAQQLLNRGAHLVIGSHPHVLQPIELHRKNNGEPKAVIAYSLGNFVSNMKIPHTVGGAILKISLHKDKRGVTIDSAAYALIFTERLNAAGKSYFSLHPAGEPARDSLKMSPFMQSQKHQFLYDARSLLQANNKEVYEYFIQTQEISPLNSVQ